MRTVSKIVEFSRTVPGYYDPDELTQLATLTRGLGKDSTIVEIGVECGRSASVFLQCPENWARLHLIDARTHNAPQGRRWLSRLLGTFQSWRLEPVPWLDTTVPDNMIVGPEEWRNRPYFADVNDPWATFIYPTPDNPDGGVRRPRTLGTDQMPNNMIFDLEATSEDYARGFTSEPVIDLLHIDADHDTGIWLDCRLWLPRVKVGGVVVFHDYMRKGADGYGDVFPNVTGAVNYHVVLRNRTDDPLHKLFCDSIESEHGPAVGEWEQIARINTQLSARRIA